MALWMIRAGRHGEREDLALEQELALVGWQELGDLSAVGSREELLGRLEEAYPGDKHKTLLNWRSQLWPFIHTIQPGDLVALPLKARPAIAIGRIAGPYQYRLDLPPDARHMRPVKWLKELPRSAFDRDLLYSLGAFMTVCRIRRNNAEARVLKLLKGGPKEVAPKPEDEEVEVPDLEQIARDQIFTHIAQRFKGHELTRLVDAVLRAQGYQTHLMPPGPDGGVDIIAGTGAMGFEAPRLAVQVKSADDAIEAKVLNELQGAMKKFGAAQGLLVAWGGFKSSVPKEAARQFFEIRLWSADELIQQIQTHYTSLPEGIQAELPLKRVWTLVLSEEGTP